MLHAGTANLDPIGQHKAALKRPRGNPSVQENTVMHIIGLPAPHNQLPVLDGAKTRGPRYRPLGDPE